MDWYFRNRILFLFLLSFCSNCFSLAEPPLFSSSEHVDIGDHVVLKFSSSDKGTMGVKLKLENGLQLTYGEVLTLGDFYGAPKEPISFGASDDDKKNRFLNAFNLLANSQTGGKEIPAMLLLIKEEQRRVDDAIKNNQSIDEVYAKIGHSFDIQYNCITGGGCTEMTWLVNQGRYLKLLQSNYDHFGDNALVAYQVGHKISLELAAEAGKTQDVQQLTIAYAINAFASHFLTDRFSTGHMRTPRVELPNNTTPSVIGSILASYMHSEENIYGLHVHNLRGDEWMAYGDKNYLKPESIRHRDLIIQTAQKSADEVFNAYVSGKVDSTNQEIARLIPYPNEIKNRSRSDISTLFYWDDEGKKLYRRKNVTSPYDRNWNKHWFSWATLIELQATRGMPSFEQAKLMNSVLGKQALKAGLITEPSLIAKMENSN